MRFTQENVRTLKAPAGAKADTIIWDDAAPGFGIRFRNGGPGNFILKYSIDGRQGKIRLGKVSQVDLKDARAAAHRHYADIARRIEPGPKSKPIRRKPSRPAMLMIFDEERQVWVGEEINARLAAQLRKQNQRKA
jgi:hypothetical protein